MQLAWSLCAQATRRSTATQARSTGRRVRCGSMFVSVRHGCQLRVEAGNSVRDEEADAHQCSCDRRILQRGLPLIFKARLRHAGVSASRSRGRAMDSSTTPATISLRKYTSLHGVIRHLTRVPALRKPKRVLSVVALQPPTTFQPPTRIAASHPHCILPPALHPSTASDRLRRKHIPAFWRSKNCSW